MATTAVSGSVEFQNGEDILDLALPETMTLMQLLDLVGEYLDLDYVYDLQTIGKQSIAQQGIPGCLEGLGPEIIKACFIDYCFQDL